jgi:hypothetical protein
MRVALGQSERSRSRNFDSWHITKVALYCLEYTRYFLDAFSSAARQTID